MQQQGKNYEETDFEFEVKGIKLNVVNSKQGKSIFLQTLG